MEYQLIEKRTCPVCHKDYGKTNLKYKEVEIWVSCDCSDKDKVYCLNPKMLSFVTSSKDCPLVDYLETSKGSKHFNSCGKIFDKPLSFKETK